MGSCAFCRIFLAVLLVLLNLFALCIGLFLVVGSSVLLSSLNTFGLFTAGLESPLILGIAAGAFLVLLAGVGLLGACLTCFGSNQVARWIATILLIGYTVVMVALIVLEIVAVVALALSREQIVETAGVWYISHLQEQIGDEASLKNIDCLQTRLHCCGFYGPEDYRNTSLGVMGALPNSCCMPNDTMVAMYNSTCHFNSTGLVDTGCYSQLEGYAEAYIAPLGVAFGVLLVAEVLCVVIPIFLIVVMFMSARREGYEKA